MLDKQTQEGYNQSMVREIIRCPDCNRVITRGKWVTLPVMISENEIEGEYWCDTCQKKFTFRHLAKVEGRSYTTDGYILVKVPLRGWISEHKYVWEKHNGKPLPLDFLLHHINGVKDDNRIENLIAIPKHSHGSHHSNNNNPSHYH